MRCISVDESKKIQVSILLYVHKFCIKNKLRYALAYGALIGAVRHGGFIPWDDDIDIIMPRNDYERFIKCFYDESGKYIVHSIENDDEYILPFAKVEDCRTLIIEKSNRENYLGISIDVFPADNMGNDYKSSKHIVRKIGILKKIYKGKLVKPNRRNSIIKIICIYVVKIFTLPFNLRKIAEKINAMSTHVGSPDANYMGDLCWGYEEREIMPKKLFDEYKNIIFEGEIVLTFKDTDFYLSRLYGEYMILPPEVQRRSPHEILGIYWRD